MPTVRVDDITTGGHRSAVELRIKTTSRNYEIKKQATVEDADLANVGRILNGVINWSRDGITIEADQRHVRDTLEDLELEQGNHAATPRTVDKKEDNARSDGSKGENQCEQGQCQTKHDWDDASDGDDKNRVQMTNDEGDDAIDSQALTGGDITKYRALVARISSYLSQGQPELKFASM